MTWNLDLHQGMFPQTQVICRLYMWYLAGAMTWKSNKHGGLSIKPIGLISSQPADIKGIFMVYLVIDWDIFDAYWQDITNESLGFGEKLTIRNSCALETHSVAPMANKERLSCLSYYGPSWPDRCRNVHVHALRDTLQTKQKGFGLDTASKLLWLEWETWSPTSWIGIHSKKKSFVAIYP